MTKILPVLGLIVGLQVLAAGQAPAPPAAISGVVVDATTLKPIAGAVVQLTPVAQPTAAGADFVIVSVSNRPARQVTDDLGRFVFADVAGNATYQLSATKYGYFDGAFGRRGLSGINNAPRRIALASGQWLRDARIDLLRPAVVTGTVRGETGSPLVDVTVRAYADIYVGGAHQLAVASTTTTDDRGEYRLTGLAPGRYVVCVPSVQQSAPAEFLSSPPPFTPDALNRDSGVRRDPAFAFDPVHRLIVPASSPPLPAAVSGQPQAYPLTFHPGVRAIGDASVIEVGAGEEKASVDVQMRPVPAFRVTGRLDGSPDAVARMSLRLMAPGTEGLGRGIEQATALVGPEGTFTFLNVPAGSYVLLASRVATEYSYSPGGGGGGGGFQVAAPGAGRGSMTTSAVLTGPPGAMLMRSSLPGSQKFQGRQNVVVSNQDVSDVFVPVQSGVSMTGRIVYENSNPDLQMPVPIVSADPANGDLALGLPRSIRDVDDDSDDFFIEAIMPGAYFMRTTGPAIKSVVWGDKDCTDTPLEVAGGKNITGVVITVTNKLPTIAGTIRMRTGEAATNAAVVLFPAERALWTNYGTQPTRIRYIAASTSGAFSLRGLPAGEYLAVALDDARADRWKEPDFFEIASRTAVRFSIGWGETRTVDVTLQDIR